MKVTNLKAFTNPETGLLTGQGYSATLGDALFATFPGLSAKTDEEAGVAIEAMMKSGNFITETVKSSNGSGYVRITPLPTQAEVTELKTILSKGKKRSEFLATLDLGVTF